MVGDGERGEEDRRRGAWCVTLPRGDHRDSGSDDFLLVSFLPLHLSELLRDSVRL